MCLIIFVIMSSDIVTAFLLLLCSLKLATSNIALASSSTDFSCPPSESIQPCMCHVLEPIPAVQCNHVNSLEIIHQALDDHFNDITIPSLKLRDCGFNELPSRAFSNLTMTRLYISNVALDFLRPDAFEGLNSLMSLALHNVTLFNFPTVAISKLPSLIILSLAENRITRIEQQHLRGINTLKYLILKENRIVHIQPRSFSPGLVSLSLSNNHLNSLHMAVRQLSNLETLFVERNRLTSLVGELEGLYNLRSLYLSGNIINHLSDSLRSLGKLKLLELQYNSIHDLGRSLDGLTRLRALNMSYNFLTTIESTTFQDLIALEVLDLSNNLLHYLDGALNPTINLKILDLSGNEFVNFTIQDIYTLVNLTKLNLENNNLTLLISDEDYDQPLKVTSLKLANNELKNLHEFLKYFPYIRQVDMNTNSITRIRYSNFEGLEYLEYLNFHGNPLICDNEQLDIINRLVARRIEVIGRPSCSNSITSL